MPLPNPRRGFKIDEAAAELGTTAPKLFKLLRENRIFNGRLPRIEHIDNGCFVIDERQFTLPGTNIKKWYTIAIATAKGMALIQETITDAVEKDGQVLPAEQQQLPRERVPHTGKVRLHLVDATY